MPDPNDTPGWHVGQRAVINRKIIVTVERITPSGRPVAHGRTFEAHGLERGGGYRRDRLEPLTDEIEAEMALVTRGRNAKSNALDAVEAAERWLRQSLSTYQDRVPDEADVDRAEKLAAAVRQIMGTPEA